MTDKDLAMFNRTLEKTLVESNDKMRAALQELQELGERGMKQNYREWITLHDKVAHIARKALEH
jgi:hypothetical protein